MKNQIFILLVIFTIFSSRLNAQLKQIAPNSQQNPSPDKENPFSCFSNSKTPTDTIMLNEFNNLPGYPAVLSYNYTNGNGHFFGTNWMDLDQNPNTPYEKGIPSCAQGFKVDTLSSYKIEEVLIRVGYKYRNSINGTPLIISVQKLDAICDYTVNTSTGPIQYSIACPNTYLSSTSIVWDSLKTGYGIRYSVAHFPMPFLVNSDYAVVFDFMDYYYNGDKIGLYCSPQGGGSNIFGKEYTLWLYPDPLLWLQVDHIYGSIDRAIAAFPVIDDGTSGIENDNFVEGLKLGQNFPNPSNNFTFIEYEIEKETSVKIEIIDSSGKTIKIFNEGKKRAGKYSIKINTNNFNSGIYFYSIITNESALTKKMIID